MRVTLVVRLRVAVELGQAPGEGDERLGRLAAVDVRRWWPASGRRRPARRRRRRRPVRDHLLDQRRSAPAPYGMSVDLPRSRRQQVLGGAHCVTPVRDGPAEQAEERAVQQRGVGRPDRVVAEQQRLPVERLDGQPDQLRVGQRGDPADQRVAVVEHQLRRGPAARWRRARRAPRPTARRPGPGLAASSPRNAADAARPGRAPAATAGSNARSTTSQPSRSSGPLRGGEERPQRQLQRRVERRRTGWSGRSGPAARPGSRGPPPAAAR